MKPELMNVPRPRHYTGHAEYWRQQTDQWIDEFLKRSESIRLLSYKRLVAYFVLMERGVQ